MLDVTGAVAFQEGLVAYYPLNGDFGNQVGDGSVGRISIEGQFVDGRFSGQRAMDQAFRDGAFESAVQIGDSSFTVAFWVMDLLEDNDQISHMAAELSSPPLFQFGPTHVGSVRFFTGFDDLEPRLDDQPIEYFKEWRHLAATYDATSRQRRIFLDGVMIADDVAAHPLQSGGESGIMFGHTGVTIDDIVVFSRVLDEAEISSLVKFDADEDELVLGEEIAFGTDPGNRDSDDDGLSDGFEIGHGRYSIVRGEFDWTGAREDASRKGGSLASFTSGLEYFHVLERVLGNEFPALWIGATDEDSEGDWRWVTGEAWTFHNWSPGQPDNRDVFGTTHFAHIYGAQHNLSGLWNDRGNSGVPEFSGTMTARLDPQTNPAISGYLLERGWSTSPLVRDSDGDGFGDGVEQQAGSNPLDAQSFPLEGGPIGPPSSVNSAPTVGLLAHYSLNGDGSNEAGELPDGSVTGVDFVEDRHGNEGGAASFTGGGQSIVVPGSAELDGLSSDYTFSFWLNSEPGEQRASYLISRNLGGNRQWNFLYWAESNPSFSVIAASADTWSGGEGGRAFEDLINSPLRVMPNEWHHVVWTTSPAHTRVFINGELIATVRSLGLRDTSGADLRIGNTIGNGNQYMGLLDDIRIYNRYLDQNEVLGLYEFESPVDPIVDVITQHPISVTVGVGLNAVFSVQVNPSLDVPFVQWFRDGLPLLGENSPRLVIEGATSVDQGLYTANIVVEGQTALSEAAMLTVIEIDTDGDGLKDHEERRAGTDVDRADTDDDGLDDLTEVTGAGTDPLNPDSDGDGLKDGLEVTQFKTDPLNGDSDGDGLSDGDEVLGEIVTDPNDDDTDSDKLTDREELLEFGTNPRSEDSDNDGLDDFQEVGAERFDLVDGAFTWSEAREDAAQRGGYLATFVGAHEWFALLKALGDEVRSTDWWLGATDEAQEGDWVWITGEPVGFNVWSPGEPNDLNGEDYLKTWNREFWNDSPGDLQLGYVLETGRYSDPNVADTDGDGFNDGDEISLGTDPSNSTDVPNPSGFLRVVGVSIGVEFVVTTEQGHSYQLQRSSGLLEWENDGAMFAGTGEDVTVLRERLADQRFWRVLVFE